MHDHVHMYANMYFLCCSKLFVDAVTPNTIQCDPWKKFSFDKNKQGFLCKHVHQSDGYNKLLHKLFSVSFCLR